MYFVTGNIVTQHGILAGGAVTVGDDGHIESVERSASLRPRSGDIDANGMWVLPGFIDLHVHGGGGADFMHGTVEAARLVARTHARFGTTGMLATTLTASRTATDAAICAARETIEGARGDDEARVLGIHLEGPYICSAKRGAQPEAYVRPPDLDEFASWVKLSGGTIRKMTLAPEVEGARALVEAAVCANVIASIGHTDARAADVIQAVEWGASHATHVFNAMRGIHHREPGTVGAVLALPEIVAEVIADGVHLDPLIVRLIVAAKGTSGVILITDAIEGTAMADGTYHLGGVPVIVKEGTAAFADGTLAGSVLTMNRAFHNCLKFTGLPPDRVLPMASFNAAKQLGISDRLGSLEAGKDADFVVMNPETGEVYWTVIGGKVAYRR